MSLSEEMKLEDTPYIPPKLYFKDKNGRYKEYVEPKPLRDDAIYIKRNGEFIPVGVYDKPHDELYEGVWIVMRHTSSREILSADYAQKLYSLYYAGRLESPPPISEIGGLAKMTNYLIMNMNKVKGDTLAEQCAEIVSILMSYKEGEQK